MTLSPVVPQSSKRPVHAASAEARRTGGGSPPAFSTPFSILAGLGVVKTAKLLVYGALCIRRLAPLLLALPLHSFAPPFL